MREGIITSYDDSPKPIELLPKDTIVYQKHLKTKTKRVEQTLFHPTRYNADFVITAPAKSVHTFFDDIKMPVHDGANRMLGHYQPDVHEYKIWVDIKSEINRFGKSDSDVTFPLKQKLLWATRKMYVNKVMLFPAKGAKTNKGNGFLFSDTFIPKAYWPEMFYKVNCKSGKVGEQKFPKWVYLGIEQWMYPF